MESLVESNHPHSISINSLVAFVNRINEDDWFAFDEVELEERVEDRSLVILLSWKMIMWQLCDWRQFWFLEFQRDWIVKNNLLKIHDLVA